jgi:hypothetical protein
VRTSTLLKTQATVRHESMSAVDPYRGIRNVHRGGGGVCEEEWDYDCGVLGCDKGSSDMQWEYLEGE